MSPRDNAKSDGDREHRHEQGKQRAPGSQLTARFFAHALASAVRSGDVLTLVRRVMPASLVRLSISALIATRAELPDMAMAAISGLSVKG